MSNSGNVWKINQVTNLTKSNFNYRDATRAIVGIGILQLL